MSRWLPVALTGALAVALIVPWRPVALGGGGLDESWARALHHAAASRWSWGSDVVFTYGPLGFLAVALDDPRTHWILIGWWIVFGLVLVSALWPMAAARFGGGWLASGWTLGALLMGAGHAGGYWFTVAALVLVSGLAGLPLGPMPLLGLGFASAVGALVKTSFAALTAIALAVVVGDRRRSPALRMAFVATVSASLVLTWLGTAQGLDDALRWMTSSLEIVRGYGDGVGLGGEPGHLAGALALAVGCALVWAGDERQPIVARVALIAFLWVVLQAAFVRDHPSVAAVVFGVLGWLTLLVAPRRGRTMFVVAALVYAALVHGSMLHQGRMRWQDPWAGFPPGLRLVGPVVQPAAAPSAPHLGGTVDVYPWGIGSLLAAGLDWRPRPVWQSYAAYTLELARRNAAALSAATRPDSLLLHVGPIDGHPPLLEDGPSWPRMWRFYTAHDGEGAFLALTRRPTPKTVRRDALAARDGELGGDLPLPGLQGGAIVARIHLRPTLRGQLVGILWRRPVVWLSVATADGRIERFRFVPGMGAAGFILSPLVRDGADLHELFSEAAGQTWLASHTVTSIVLDAPRWAWRTAYRVELVRHYPWSSGVTPRPASQ